MTSETDHQAEPVEIARRLARLWGGARNRLEEHGMPKAEIGKSLVAAGLVAWIEAEGAEATSAAFHQLAQEIFDTGFSKSH
ncbi:hypothetical protein [Xanthobacter autotrophicus]|uniref:hypothetical protein n=1 Tax=Xanthobacter autotrophicus TaxID=280 RepID=UPI00372AADEA